MFPLPLSLPILALLSLPFLPLFFALDDASMRPRSVYQVITDRFALTSGSTSTPCIGSERKYCGGSWKGMESRLSYIQGMGFDTIWISPIVENIGGTTGQGQAYHGYWGLDVTKLNDRFGSEADLKALVQAVHSRGMYIMVDVVVNHVAATSSSTFSPSASYGPFSTQEDYHPFCWIADYTNQTQVEDCWLGDTDVALADLNTESPTVVAFWNEWIEKTVSTYNFDAIRIDTAKHVRHSFWPDFVAAAGVYNVGEILQGDPVYVAAYQKEANVNPFDYPTYYPLARAFNTTSGNMSALVDMVASVKREFADPTLLGSFLDNHDNPRFGSWQQDQKLVMNAQAYPLVTDGIPFVYYGSEAGFNGGADPENREALWLSGYDTASTMYTFLQRLNAARSAAGNASTAFYNIQMTMTSPTPSTLLISKPPLISLLTNIGSSSSSGNTTQVIPSSASQWGPNTRIIDAISCSTLTTDGSANLAVEMDGYPKVFIEVAKKGRVCANSTGKDEDKTGAATERVGLAGGMVVWAVVALGWMAGAGVFV